MARVIEAPEVEAPARPAPDEVSAELHPSLTSDLLGHEDAEQTLAAALSGGNLHHAWLLAGPPGIGKATLAWRFARALLDSERGGGLFGDPPDDLHVDPGSGLFTQVAGGAHPNLMVLRRQWDFKARPPKYYTVIRVDDVRKLTGFLGQSASREGRRVVLIDAADDLQFPSASNALLKPLEEPPANTIFILVCHQPGRLLPTIRSRCRRLDLRPPDRADATTILTRAEPELDNEAAGMLLHLADGSPGRALRLHNAGGLEIYQDLLGLLGDLPRLSREKAQKLAGQMDNRATGEGAFNMLFDQAEGFLRRLLGFAATGEAAFVSDHEAALATRLAPAGLEQWFDVCDNLQRLRERTESVNLNRKAVTLTLFSAFEEAARRAAA